MEENATSQRASTGSEHGAAPRAGEMGDVHPCEASQRFWGVWQDLERVYERYARQRGLSYTSLTILAQVYSDHFDGIDCTQRSICDMTHLPKQTVNSVVSGLCRDGLVELVELPHDRRAKAIHLTEAGIAYARELVEPVNEAERIAFSQLTDEERAQFFDALSRFATAYANQMLAPGKRAVQPPQDEGAHKPE